MRRYRKTKIAATLGPASSTPEMIRTLFMAGVDVFRLNFSHGSHESHAQNIEYIRALEKDLMRPIGIMMDLQGPKFRVGTFAIGPVQLNTGQTFKLFADPSHAGDASGVSFPHGEIYHALKVGQNLLLDDGKLRLRVTNVSKEVLTTEIVIGGELKERKGVNLPDVVLPISVLTEKDQTDLQFGLKMGVDFVALSFVQTAEDVRQLKKIIGDRAHISSKIEKPSAVENIAEIIACSDSIMLARGDLGVEMPPEQVPILQKRIIKEARQQGKPVIVATQMLESMTQTPVPTRAEASDVATAVYEGADAVMLSAESASGQYPLEAVSMMDKIITSVESDAEYVSLLEARHIAPQALVADAITEAAWQVAKTLNIQTIASFTAHGSTAYWVAQKRPMAAILGLTPKLHIARQLTLVWGVHPLHTETVQEFKNVIEVTQKLAQDHGFAKVGERIIVTAGIPTGHPGTTNLLHIVDIMEN